MTTAAHKYLETLQRDAYARIGISEESAIDSLRVATAQVMPEFLKRDDAYRSEMKKELADILRRLVEQRQRAGLAITPRQIAELESDLQHEISRNMPPFTDTAKPSTKFEDPLSTFFISEWRQLVESTIKTMLLTFAREPTIGTLPTGRANAIAISIPESDEYVVALHSGLIPFIGLIAKICAKSISFTRSDNGIAADFSKDSIRKTLTSNSRGVKDFQEILEAYLVVGRPGALGSGSETTRDEGVFAGVLLNCMGTFVLGHEYSHIFANHLSSAQRAWVTIGDKKQQEILWNWQTEDEADSYGVLIMLRAMGSQELWLRFWGPKLYLACTSIVEKALSILRTGAETRPPLTRSHPPTELRQSHIDRFMITYLEQRLKNSGEQSVKETTTVLDATKALDEILKILWEYAKPKLYYLYQNGIQLAPIWS